MLMLVLMTLTLTLKMFVRLVLLVFLLLSLYYQNHCLELEVEPNCLKSVHLQSVPLCSIALNPVQLKNSLNSEIGKLRKVYSAIQHSNDYYSCYYYMGSSTAGHTSTIPVLPDSLNLALTWVSSLFLVCKFKT